MSTEEKKTIDTGDSTGGDEVSDASLQQPDTTPTPVSQSANPLQDLTDAELEAVTGGASPASSEVSVSVNGTGDVIATNPGAQTPLSK